MFSTLASLLRELRAWRHFVLALILAVGLVHGLLYVFLVPLWQHYDEPTHFEYAWLVANRPSWPAVGDYDQGMRRQVAVSMINNGFFYGLSFLPDLNVTTEPIWLGISELHQQPLYYALASLPLRLMRGADVGQQLYAARLVSLSLLLLSIVAAWLITGMLAPPGHALRWLVPALMALLPGFVDLMTAVNNDVSAVAAFSLFLWACLRLALQPLRIANLVLAVALVALCYFAKVNTLAAAPILVVALGMTLLRGHRRPWLWFGAGVAALAVLGVSLMWGDAAWWYRDSAQTSATRQPSPGAPLGAYALALETPPGGAAPLALQVLSPADAASLRGLTVTVGAWIWASEPVTLSALQLYDYNRLDTSLPVPVGTLPTFYALTAALSADASAPRVVLHGASPGTRTVSVHFDGVTLVPGAMPAGTRPVFTDASGATGNWAGQPFRNLLRNPSAEDAWFAPHPRLNPVLDRIFNLYVPPPLILMSPLDWNATGWYYQTTADVVLRTFWAKFGWGHVPLRSTPAYGLLFAITAIGLIGGVLALAIQRRRLPTDALVIFGLAAAAIWGETVFLCLHSLASRGFVPGARFAFPAIVPTLALLTAGWWMTGSPVRRALRLPAWTMAGGMILGFLILDAYSLYSLVTFYAGRSG